MVAYRVRCAAAGVVQPVAARPEDDRGHCAGVADHGQVRGIDRGDVRPGPLSHGEKTAGGITWSSVAIVGQDGIVCSTVACAATPTGCWRGAAAVRRRGATPSSLAGRPLAKHPGEHALLDVQIHVAGRAARVGREVQHRGRVHGEARSRLGGGQALRRVQPGAGGRVVVDPAP